MGRTDGRERERERERWWIGIERGGGGNREREVYLSLEMGQLQIFDRYTVVLKPYQTGLTVLYDNILV